MAVLGIQGLLLLVSCDRPAPADYDETKNQTLSKICRLLQNGHYEEAIALLKEKEPSDNALLVEVLSSYVNERQLLVKANEALKKGQYDDLARLIEQAEKRGDASPELLEYRSAPQALQALQVFCSRMPWEKTEDMDHAMNWLKPYLPVLQGSPVFVVFWQQQLQQRNHLLLQQFTKAEETLLEQIDRQLSENQRTAAWNSVEKLWQLNPQHLLFSFLDRQQRSLKADFAQCITASPQNRSVFEYALTLSYPHLSRLQRESVASFFPPPENTIPLTLSGMILAAELLELPEFYALAYQRWAALSGKQESFPGFMEKLLSELFSQPEQFNARCWRTPCPNLTDFFARINQIAVNMNQQDQRKKP